MKNAFMTTFYLNFYDFCNEICTKEQLKSSLNAEEGAEISSEMQLKAAWDLGVGELLSVLSGWLVSSERGEGSVKLILESGNGSLGRLCMRYLVAYAMDVIYGGGGSDERRAELVSSLA